MTEIGSGTWPPTITCLVEYSKAKVQHPYLLVELRRVCSSDAPLLLVPKFKEQTMASPITTKRLHEMMMMMIDDDGAMKTDELLYSNVAVYKSIAGTFIQDFPQLLFYPLKTDASNSKLLFDQLGVWKTLKKAYKYIVISMPLHVVNCLEQPMTCYRNALLLFS